MTEELPLQALVAGASFVGAVLALATGVLLWRRRRGSSLATPLTLVMLGSAGWALCRTISYALRGPDWQTLLDYAVYPFAALVTAAAFWYFAVLAGHRHRLGRRGAVLLSVHPVLLLLTILTDSRHRLFYSGAAPDTGVGPLFWVHVAYSYLLLVTGLVVVVVAMVRAVAGHRSVFVITLLGAGVPVVGNAVSLLTLSGARDLHITPVLLLVTAATWLWVERYSSQTRLVPVSARQVLEALDDAVLVVDPEGRLLDLNPAAARLTSATAGRQRVVGLPLAEVLDPEMVRIAEGGGRQTIHTSAGTSLEVRVSSMATEGGEQRGTVVVVRDVTEVERLRRELAEQAARDGLTGLHNRRHLEAALADAVSSAHALGEPLSAVMVDIDHFKRVNDTLGHAAGDELLVKVAQELLSGARPDDVVARYGGEEFVLLLRGVTADVAARRADLVRGRCRGIAVRSGDRPLGVTLSAGVAELGAGWSGEDLLRAADAALYAAKSAGRDAVVLASTLVRGSGPV